MRFELVIFDCDGVLVDSEPIANRIFSDELHKLGLDWSFDDVVSRFVGRTMASCIAEVERELGRAVPRGFVDRLQSRTFRAFERELVAVPHIVEALDAIDAPTCVASSGEPSKMRLTLGRTGLLSRFEDRIFSAVEVARSKPFPDLFLHAARKMEVLPEHCAVIEDSPLGIQAAVAAGMTAFGFAGGLHDADELGRAGATVFDDMRQLPELLG